DPALASWRAPVHGWVDVKPGTTGVVFNRLDFDSPVLLQPGSQHTTVENSTLQEGLLEDPGQGASGGNVITHNTVMDRLALTGAPTAQTADQVACNQFVGHGSLLLSHDNGAYVARNGFSTDARWAFGGALQVEDGANVTISGNSIHFTPPSAGAPCLSILA